MQEINNRRETKQFTQNIETELRFNPESTWTCGFYSNTLLMIPHVDTNPLVHTSWVQWLLAISNSLKSTILFSNKPWSILLNVLTKLRFILFFGISLWAIMFPRLGFIYCDLAGTYQRQLFFFFVPERSFFCKWHSNHGFKCFWKCIESVSHSVVSNFLWTHEL